MSGWLAIAGTAVACYLLKLLGLAMPATVTERPTVRRVAALLPVALLAALTALQTFGDGPRLTLDARAAGMAAALAAVLLRAPFLVVVISAVVVTGVVRALTN